MVCYDRILSPTTVPLSQAMNALSSRSSWRHIVSDGFGERCSGQVFCSGTMNHAMPGLKVEIHGLFQQLSGSWNFLALDILVCISTYSNGVTPKTWNPGWMDNPRSLRCHCARLIACFGPWTFVSTAWMSNSGVEATIKRMYIIVSKPSVCFFLWWQSLLDDQPLLLVLLQSCQW